MSGEGALTRQDTVGGKRRDRAARDTTGRLSPMGLLPCLRRGSDRWWLPCSHVATDALGHTLLATGRGTMDLVTRERLVSALQIDPPLLIYAALGWPGEQAGPEDLADWLCENVAGRFASGDAFLGAPETDSASLGRWKRLRDHYRTVPFESWLQDAALWLEVTGPSVSTAWQAQWPQLVGPEKEPVGTLDRSGNGMLQQLARMMQRERSLEQSFDRTLRKSKLGALKQLAYGLSHEINNPLANISTRAQQLQRGEEDTTRHAILQRIVDQVYRAHEMIADLMFFANPSTPAPQLVDLNQTLVAVVDNFQDEAQRQAIRLEVETPTEPTNVIVDRDMVAEALRALVRNSIEAIGCQGTIVVSLVRHPEQFMIHVADSGPGLSEEARRHAFDPYFSGREAGRGLGLGLCRAYRVAKLHHGDITLAGGPAGCVATITLHESS